MKSIKSLDGFQGYGHYNLKNKQIKQSIPKLPTNFILAKEHILK